MKPLTREWLEAQLKLCEAATPGACALFVAARTDYPAVLREVIRLQAQIATAREVLGETIAMLNAQRRDMLSELPDDHRVVRAVEVGVETAAKIRAALAGGT